MLQLIWFSNNDHEKFRAVRSVKGPYFTVNEVSGTHRSEVSCQESFRAIRDDLVPVLR
jgi:hypothetical protein